MKEIQGKIKFGVIDIEKITPEDIIEIYRDYQVLVSTQNSIRLSEITEEQAADFVEYYYINGDYKQFMDYVDGGFDYTNPKQSLISLLKANDIWIKEWADAPIKPELGFYCEGETAWESYDNRLEDYYNEMEDYNKLPDDLLLIRLQ